MVGKTLILKGFHSNFLLNLCRITRYDKRNVSKVGAYCSASDHQIRKISLGVYQESYKWFEEYLKIIENEIGVCSFLAFSAPLQCLIRELSNIYSLRYLLRIMFILHT